LRRKEDSLVLVFYSIASDILTVDISVVSNHPHKLLSEFERRRQTIFITKEDLYAECGVFLL
jgi:hypothetical protein